MGDNTRDYIRLELDLKQKCKSWGLWFFNLSIKYFEPNVMVAGGIFHFCLANLIFVQGTINDFTYSTSINFYKEDN